MKNWLICIGLSFIVLPSAAQVQYVLPLSDAKSGALTAVAQDWEAIGVNPANLGWNTNHSFSFTLLNAGISGQSEGMSFPGLMNAFYGTSLLTRANAWQGILGSSEGMNTNADVNWFALSFKIHALPGTFAVNMTDKIQSNAFLGFNASQALSTIDNRIYNDATTLALLNGTSLTYTHYREINLDYGVKLFNWGGHSDDNTPATKCYSFSGSNIETGIYGGIGVKYIMGIANVNGSVSNADIDALYDMNEYYPNIPSGFFNTPGQGEAVDLGLGLIHGQWKAGVSLIDIGSIRWKNGYKTTTDTGVASITHGSDFINELENGTLYGSSRQPGYYTTPLPTEMKWGVSYSVNKRILLSTDIIFPLNKVPGELSGPYLAFGSQLELSKLITLSPGLAFSVNNEWAIPIGLTIHATPNLDFYVGTGDIASYMGKSNADVSFAVGLLRFYF